MSEAEARRKKAARAGNEEDAGGKGRDLRTETHDGGG